MGWTYDEGSDKSATQQYIEWSGAGTIGVPETVDTVPVSNRDRAMRASAARYAGAAEQYARLQRSEALRRTREQRAQSVGASSGMEYERQYAGLSQYFGMFSRRDSGPGTLAWNQTVALPSWVTQSMIDEIRRTGMYGGKPLSGFTPQQLQGFGAANYMYDPDTSTGTEYLGVANSWEDGYFAVGRTPSGFVIREAIYTPNSVVAEISKMTQDELIDFRGKAALVNLHAQARGQKLTGETFGLAQDQGAADQDVMAYVMGFANENAMTWQGALNAITQQATSDYNEGLFDLDGSTPGSGAEPPPPPLEKKTQTTYNMSDLAAARDLLTTYMQSKTGRLPRAGEVENFLSLMNAAEKKNPDVRVEEYEHDEFGRVIDTTVNVTEGNIDYGQMALDEVDTEESRQFQTDMAFETIKKLAGW